MLTELLTDCTVFLKHYLLVLGQLAQLLLCLRRCLIQDFLQVNSGLLTRLQVLFNAGFILTNVLEEEKFLGQRCDRLL